MQRSIQRRLILAFAGLAVLPILIASFTLYRESSDALLEMTLRHQRLEAERVGVAVRGYVRQLVQTLTLTGRAHAFLSLPADRQKEILDELLAYENRFETLSTLNREGEETVRCDRTHVVSPGTLRSRASDAAFCCAKTTGKISYSPVFFDAQTGEPYMEIAVPLESLLSGKVEAVLLGTARLKKLWNLLGDLSHTGESVFIVNDEGQLIGHRDPSIVLQERQYLHDHGPNAGQTTGLDGTPVIMACKSIRFGPHVLHIIAEQPRRNALALTRSIRSITLLAAGLALSVAVGLAIVLVRSLVRPLRTLSAAARNIQNGDLNQRVELQTHDEISELADAFNAMTQRLVKTIEELQLEVEERKREMQDRIRAEGEKLALEQRLRQSQKMEAIGTLAGGIAHDFNNMLGAILGRCEMLQRRTDPESKEGRWLKQIETAGERGSRMVQQILTFSRQSPQEFLPLNPAQVLEESLEFLRGSIPATIGIQTAIEDCGFILGDRTQFHQVVVNLCTNAHHAMKETGGKIGLSLHEAVIPPCPTPAISPVPAPGRYVYLTLSDTGTGMPPEVLSRVFDPYFTTKGIGEGTGMGLSIVHGIIRNHHGEIGIESTEGVGTTFHILFPKIPDPEPEPQKAPDQSTPCGNEHVLVVDDEEAMVQVHSDILEELGYRVTRFTDSRKALNAVQETPDAFDLVLSDVTMPELTGLQLTEEIRSIRQTLPVILCTGYNDQVTRESALAAGADRYLKKPIPLRDLSEQVRELLDQYAGTAQPSPTVRGKETP